MNSPRPEFPPVRYDCGGTVSASVKPASAILIVLGSSVFAQPGAARPDFGEFEVASIKPTPPDAGGRWIRMLSANEFAARNHAVRSLIMHDRLGI